MIRTFETRIDKADTATGGAVLDAFSALYNLGQRKAHAYRSSGKTWDADGYRPIYMKLGLNSQIFLSLVNDLEGKVDSIRELAKLHVETLTDKLDAQEKKVTEKVSKLAKATETISQHKAHLEAAHLRVAKAKSLLDRAKPEQQSSRLNAYKLALNKLQKVEHGFDKAERDLQALPFVIHQGKRRLGNLKDKLVVAREQIENPSVCFGSKKLFKQQFKLRSNGFKNHDAWLDAFRDRRDSTFVLNGHAGVPGGNDIVKFHVREDGCVDLEIRLPPALVKYATKKTLIMGRWISSITLQNLHFNEGHEVVCDAAQDRRPVTYRFLRDATGWKVFATVDHKIAFVPFENARGVLGVDLNVGHISVTHVDARGNPLQSWNYPCDSHGLSSEQAQDVIRKVALRIARLSLSLGNLPIVSERLDFADKKAALTNDHGARYARMLSSFHYSQFDAALHSALRRNGVCHRRVNPAYTSIIGRVKFAPRYGSSVHAAAAIAIARRAMRYSERLPLSVDGTIHVPLGAGDSVTLNPPARMGQRHVWSSWRVSG